MLREGKQVCCAQLSLLCIYYCSIYLPGASSFSKPNNSDPVVYLCRGIKVTPIVKGRKTTQKLGPESCPDLGVAAKLFPALGITFQVWEHQASQLQSDLWYVHKRPLFFFPMTPCLKFSSTLARLSPQAMGKQVGKLRHGGGRKRLERCVSGADGRQ